MSRGHVAANVPAWGAVPDRRRGAGPRSKTAPLRRRPQRDRYAAARTPQEAQDHQEPLAPPPEEWPPDSELELKEELLDELDELDESDESD